MRRSCLVARGLSMAAAVLIASPAVAAPARHQKPRHDAPAKKTKGKPAADTDDQPAPTADDEAPAKPPETPIKLEEDPAPPSAARSKPAQKPPADAAQSANAPIEPEAPLEPESRASDDREAAALGRREAARIAAHRIEVAVSASVDVGNRRFTYSDPVGRLLAPYRLPVAPMLSFGVEAYPWASTELPVLRDLGFRGRLSRALAVDSNTPQGGTIETSWTRFGGELRERVLVPGQHPFELGVFGGADGSYFGMSTKSKIPALLPAARTVSLRFGADARLLVTGRLSLMLGSAYLFTTSSGEIYDQFRGTHVAGVDGDLGCVLGIVPGLEARLTARYTRYFATFKPALGDPNVAGGALDEQMQFGLGARYAH
jgi:hypothetical protein